MQPGVRGGFELVEQLRDAPGDRLFQLHQIRQKPLSMASVGIRVLNPFALSRYSISCSDGAFVCDGLSAATFR